MPVYTRLTDRAPPKQFKTFGVVL